MKKIKSKKFVAVCLAVSMLFTTIPAWAEEAPEAATNTQVPEVTVTKPAYNDGHFVGRGGTVVSGLLFVNKKYPLPAAYAPAHAGGAGQSLALYGQANQAMKRFLADCNAQGNSMYVLSAYRSYNVQAGLFNRYAAIHGIEKANTFSARAGQSEHQSGLSFDVGDAKHSAHNLEISIEQFPGVRWMMEHCSDYGFILRFPKGKEDITGYQYEPWHFRYVGVAAAKAIQESGLTLEEFVGAVGDRKMALGRDGNALSIDGEKSAVASYNIDGFNYFRLRDLGTMLMQTPAAFDVGYDAEQQIITLHSHTAYSQPPSLITLSSLDIALPNPMPVVADGLTVAPQAYNINGFTYFKLRDLGEILGFGVDWDEANHCMLINTADEPVFKSLIAPATVH